MFFLLRSAFCITLVVVALPDGTPSRDASVRSALATVRDLCHADPHRCLSLVGDRVAALLPDPVPPQTPKSHPSRDTLRPDDLRHPWAGSAGEARS